MTHNIKSALSMAVAAMMAATATAQNLNTGYFTDGYLYRHNMNPALANEQSYVSMLGIGNLGLSMQSNFKVSDFLYNVDGRTTTFLNPKISADEFLSNLDDVNKLSTDINVSILSVGFKSWGGYNTIGLGVRGNMGMQLPTSVFRLAKEGINNSTYDISDLNAQAQAYAELSFGHSRQIDEQWRVGGALKLLFGIGNIEANFNKAELKLDNDAWSAVTDAEINASMKGLTYEMESTMRGPEDHQTEHRYVNGANIDGGGMNGFGLAFDLGAEFKLDDDWKFSAALLDLGFISWSNNMVASTDGEKSFTTDKYTFNVVDDKPNSFSNEMDRLTEDLSALYELQDKGDQGGRTTGIGATLNLGAEYTLPSYRALTFGLLNSTRINGQYSWTEFRLSTNYAPAKLYSTAISLAVGTYGASFGWIANLHPNGFNLYVGMDHTLGKLAKQGLPMSGNANVFMGMNFPF